MLDSSITIPFIGVSYGVHFPKADLAVRSGTLQSIGGQFGMKFKSGLYLGFKMDYLFGTTVKEPGVLDNIRSGLADPKDRVEVWNLLGEAEAARSSQSDLEAAALFDRVLSVEPANPFALSRSGALLVESGVPSKVEEGVRRLEASLEVSPRDAEAWAILAAARGRLGRWPQAADAWQEVVRLQPRRRDAWIGFANALGLSKRPKEAVLAFERWLEIDPTDSEVFLRVAFARVPSGDLAGAAKDLTQAASLQGAKFQHSAALGILLSRLGRAEEALPWLRRSQVAEADFVEARLALARLEAQTGNEQAARDALEEAVGKDPSLVHRLATDPLLGKLLP